MTGALVVRVADATVGRLWLDEKKRFCFQYDPLWRRPGCHVTINRSPS